MSMLPNDDEPGCGYGIFKLPDGHEFNRACVLHDHEFALAEKGQAEKTRAKADIELFFRWTLIAKNQPNEEKTIELLWDIVKFWPLARLGGYFMWDQGDLNEDKNNVEQLIEIGSSGATAER